MSGFKPSQTFTDPRVPRRSSYLAPPLTRVADAIDLFLALPDDRRNVLFPDSGPPVTFDPDRDTAWVTRSELPGGMVTQAEDKSQGCSSCRKGWERGKVIVCDCLSTTDVSSLLTPTEQPTPPSSTPATDLSWRWHELPNASMETRNCACADHREAGEGQQIIYDDKWLLLEYGRPGRLMSAICHQASSGDTVLHQVARTTNGAYAILRQAANGRCWKYLLLWRQALLSQITFFFIFYNLDVRLIGFVKLTAAEINCIARNRKYEKGNLKGFLKWTHIVEYITVWEIFLWCYERFCRTSGSCESG